MMQVMRPFLSLLALLLLRFPSANCISPRQSLNLLSSQTKGSNVLYATQQSFKKFVVGDGAAKTNNDDDEQYAVVAFFNAKESDIQGKEAIQELLGSFDDFAGHMSRGIVNSGGKQDLFFLELEYAKSPQIFQAFEVNSLPFVIYVGKGDVRSHTSLESLAAAAKMNRFKGSGQATVLDEIRVWIKEMHGVEYPNVVDNSGQAKRVTFFVATLAIVGYAIYTSKLYRLAFIPSVWLVSFLFIYMFGVSGTMKSIIKGSRFIGSQRNGMNEYFRGGNDHYGIEGWIMSALYMCITASLFFVATQAEKIQSSKHSRFAVGVLLALFLGLVHHVVEIYRWKTGYNFTMHFG